MFTANTSLPAVNKKEKSHVLISILNKEKSSQAFGLGVKYSRGRPKESLLDSIKLTGKQIYLFKLNNAFGLKMVYLN